MLCKKGQCVNYFSKRYRWQFFSGLTATFGCLIAGNMISWSSIIFPQMLAEMKTYGLTLTPCQISWITSIPFLAAFFAILPSKCIMNKIGPKRTLMLYTIPCLTGWALMGFSQNYAMLLCGRFLTGLAVGPFLAIIPIYVYEIAEPLIHDKLKMVIYQHFAVGLITFIIQSLFEPWWKNTLMAGLIPLQMLIILFFMPESPKYLLSKGQMDKGMDSLKVYRGAKDIQEIVPEFKEIMKQIEEEKTSDSQNLLSILNQVKENLIPITTSSVLLSLQLMTGITLLLLYPFNILALVPGYLLNPAISFTIILIGLLILSNLIGTLCNDQLTSSKRKIAAYVSLCILTLSGFSTALVVHFGFKNFNYAEPAKGIILWGYGDLILCITVLFYLATFCITSPIPWILLEETGKNSQKGCNSAILLTVASLVIFIITQTFDLFNTLLGLTNYLWICGCCSLIATLLTVYLLPKCPEKVPKIEEKVEDIKSENTTIIESNGNGHINTAFETDAV